jgi:hypothetical protein
MQPKTWNVAGASVIGSSHMKLGLPCQDSHDYAVQDEFLLAAIADGAGSAAKAEIGSRTAANAARAHLLDLLSNTTPDAKTSEQAVLGAIEAARRALEEVALRDSVSLREFATTLIVLIASRGFIAVAQIGDGGVVGCLEGELKTLTRPPIGEYINEVTFLTTDNYRDHIQLAANNPCPEQIAAFTDGLQMLALQYPDGQPFGGFFKPLFNLISEGGEDKKLIAQIEEFLGSTRLNERTDDDKTLLLAALTG